MNLFRTQHTAKKGFTLIELMVSVGIFALMTAFFLFRSDKFDGGIILTNLAYDVALTIREAQTYGMNVMRDPSGSFTSPYGVYFNLSNPTQFILYTTTDSQGRYNASSEIVKTYNIRRGNRVDFICYGTSAATCNQTPTSLSIAFIRPHPEAIFGSGSNYAVIRLRGRDGESTRNIVVRKTGQISVE